MCQIKFCKLFPPANIAQGLQGEEEGTGQFSLQGSLPPSLTLPSFFRTATMGAAHSLKSTFSSAPTLSSQSSSCSNAVLNVRGTGLGLQNLGLAALSTESFALTMVTVSRTLVNMSLNLSTIPVEAPLLA